MSDPDRVTELLKLMGTAQTAGDQDEFQRLGAEVSAIVHSPEADAQVAQLLMGAAWSVLNKREWVNVSELNAMRAEIKGLKHMVSKHEKAARRRRKR